METKYPYDAVMFPSNAKSVKEAEVIVFGVPYDSTVDFLPGTRFGPKAIREAANFIEPFDIETRKNILEEVKIIDIGDLEPVRGDSEKTVERVKEQVSEILKMKKFPLMLGGEHLISLGAVKALPERTKIVSFDAHYDLKEVWEGSKYAHNTWLRRACETVGKGNVCIIGVRAGDEFEFEYSKQLLVNPSGKKLMDFVKKNDVYLTIDMDVLDPSIAPAVGTPEPAGLQYLGALSKLTIISENSRLLGFDVVETSPNSATKTTETMAAKLIFKTLLSYAKAFK